MQDAVSPRACKPSPDSLRLWWGPGDSRPLAFWKLCAASKALELSGRVGLQSTGPRVCISFPLGTRMAKSGGALRCVASFSLCLCLSVFPLCLRTTEPKLLGVQCYLDPADKPLRAMDVG